MDARPVEFVELPPPVQIQLAIGGPLLVGAISGFLLSETETGYWILAVLASIGGVLGGMEHPGAKAGAGRGLLGGFFFGVGMIIADAIANNEHLVETTDPFSLILVVTTIAGIVLGALGGVIGGRLAGTASPG